MRERLNITRLSTSKSVPILNALNTTLPASTPQTPLSLDFYGSDIMTPISTGPKTTSPSSHTYANKIVYAIDINTRRPALPYIHQLPRQKPEKQPTNFPAFKRWKAKQERH